MSPPVTGRDAAGSVGGDDGGPGDAEPPDEESPAVESHDDPGDAAPPPGRPQDPQQPPRWFDVAVVTCVALLASAGLIGLSLGIAGIFRTWVTLLLAVPISAAAGVVAWRTSAPGPRARHATVGALLALLIVAGSTAFVASFPSQNVVASRDPGSYLNTALWMSRTGSLEVAPSQDAFRDVDGLGFGAAAVYELDDGTLQFQFNHLSSTILAIAHDLGGYRLMFRVPALAMGLGLLVVYSLAVRITRRPYVALAAPALLALSAPILHVGRNAYSEPFTLPLLWGAVLLLASLHRRPSVPLALVGGAFGGALLATRVDAMLYVALLFPLAAISVCGGDDAHLRRRRIASWAAAAGSMAVTGVVGWVDLTTRTGTYVDDLAAELQMLRALALASLVVSVLGAAWWLRRRRPPPTWIVRRRGWFAGIAGSVVVLVLLFGWWVRPHVQVVEGDKLYQSVIDAQARDGLEPEPFRLYHEDSLRWMQWYLGAPALLAAIAGFGWSVDRFIRGRLNAWHAATLVVGLVGGALYWWRPSITPDHLWAMRRFVPAVLPALALLAVSALALGVGMALGRLRSPWRWMVVAVAVLALLVPPAVTTWPVRWQRDQYGYQQVVAEACAMVGPGNALIVVGARATLTLGQTLRSWCGVPVAAQGRAFGRQPPDVGAAEVARDLADNGWGLVLIADDVNHLDGYLVDGGPRPRSTTSAQDLWAHEPTVDRPPDRYRRTRDEPSIRSPFQLHLLTVAPDELT